MIYLPTHQPSQLSTAKASEDEIGRAALKDWLTWHFSMKGLPLAGITANHCELLPHIFTIAISAEA